MLKNKILIFLAAFAFLFAACSRSPKELVILHTNDVHSQVEPVDTLGGYAGLYHLIDSIRQNNPNMLLVDAGDLVQGSPYFNLFHGRVEFGAYKLLGYDAITLGNHEFDLGLDTLAARIKESGIPVICSNYDVTGTPLEGLTKPYLILNRKGLKIGIIGLGISPKSLILPDKFGSIKYENPVEKTMYYGKMLKEQKHCDFVLVLSHLGFKDPGSPNITDSQLAVSTRYIDMILGGHTHKIGGDFKLINIDGDTIHVIQEHHAGRKLYKITLEY